MGSGEHLMSSRKNIIENAIENLQRNATERQLEAGRDLMQSLSGDRKAGHRLAEAISTSDIPSFMTPAVNAIFLAEFAETPVMWDTIADEYRTDRFQNIEWYGFDFDSSNLEGVIDGEEFTGYGLPGVAELGEYPAVSFKTETVNGEMRKYGTRVRMSWETSLKTGSFEWLPRAARQLARWAAEAEDMALVQKFISSAGVVNTAFADAPLNPALTYQALEAAMLQSQAVEVNGRRTNATSFQLVTGYGLSLTARDILNTTSITRTDGSDEYVINPSLAGVGYTPWDALDKFGGSTVSDYWFVVPKGTARPAFLALFHEDNRVPLISLKDPRHFSVAGGALEPLDGSFELDDVEARVRHVVGAATIAPQIVVASTGAGS